MTSEEKEAIKLLKQEPDYSLSYYKREKAIDIVLKLVEKQQKEIEEWRNGIRINDKVSVPKDKIRTKIQIYKDKEADIVGMLSNYERWSAKIEILQELLEEE